MSTLAEHFATVSFPHGAHTDTLRVTQVDIDEDDERTPFVGATVSVPLDAHLLGLDPTATDIPVTIDVSRVFGRLDRLSDLTRLYRDHPISVISDTYRGLTIADMTAAMYHDYDNPGTARHDETRSYQLWLRAVDIDFAADALRLALSSAEALLRDHYRADATPQRVAGADLVEKVNTILAERGTGPIDYVSTTVPIPSDAEIGDEADWQPGESAWDIAMRLSSTHGFSLWSTSNADWHLRINRDTAGATRLLTTTGPDRTVTQIRQTRDRDDGWINAAMVKYRDDAGNVTYDVSTLPPSGPVRLHVVDANGVAGDGRAEKIRANLAPRGFAVELEAVSTFDHMPGYPVTVQTPSLQLNGRMSAVRWQIPADTMSIRLRDVEMIA